MGKINSIFNLSAGKFFIFGENDRVLDSIV